MNTAVSSPSASPATAQSWTARFFAVPGAGALVALVVAGVVFSVTTDTFFTATNLSLLLQQAVVVGTLALGQTLIILTAGIDLANGAIAVLGTVIAAKIVYNGHGNPVAALVVAFVICLVAGTVSGVLVTMLRLPAFIVTLGLLTVLTAGTRIYAESASYPVTDDLLLWLGRIIKVGSLEITYGSVLLLVTYAYFWYLLTQTTWGVHVYAIGNNPEAARLSGIHTARTLISVYVIAAGLYALAAWQALGRIPNADANAYQSGNLDSITAVVIGGTSLFGGRGGVIGTLIGTLIVGVLRSGLTQAGIDANYQDVGTGALVIAAVVVDQISRRRQR
jgi:fructose transport system permease protein